MCIFLYYFQCPCKIFSWGRLKAINLAYLSRKTKKPTKLSIKLQYLHFNFWGSYFWNSCYREVVKSFIQGVLPGIILKIFLILLPMILMAMSKIEGYTSLSSLDRRSATKYYFFILVNVFLGSIITGAAFEQLQRFVEEPPSEWVPTARLNGRHDDMFTDLFLGVLERTNLFVLI